LLLFLSAVHTFTLCGVEFGLRCYVPQFWLIVQAAAEAEGGTKRAAGAAELAAMRAFQISGATGPRAPDVNGVYTRTDELKNGKPVFCKVDTGGARCCWFARTNRWMVSPVKHKDANTALGAAKTKQPCLPHPAMAGMGWEVGTGGSGFVVQPKVAVRVLSRSEAASQPSILQPWFALMVARAYDQLERN
jgi:hypothetical protein